MSEKEFNQLFAKNLNFFLNLNKKNQLDLAEYIGVSPASVSNWCKGLKLPRMDKVDLICRFFSIQRSDLLEDKAQEQSQGYYLNEDARDMAQFMYENPDYKVLFDATRKVKKEDIEFVKQFIDKMSGNTAD